MIGVVKYIIKYVVEITERVGCNTRNSM